jgi:hypothetical protein
MIHTENEISTRLSVLVGLNVSGVSRAVDMLVFQFGPLTKRLSSKGTQTFTGDWSLHIQCPWRIEYGQSIYTGRSDMFEPAQALDGAVYRDEPSTLLDSKLRDLFIETIRKASESPSPAAPMLVTAVHSDTWGGVSIGFSTGHSLAIFPDGSASEDWRFFSFSGAHPHLVIEGGALDPDSLA